MVQRDELTSGCTMTDLTARALLRFGERVALDGNGGRLTYREYAERASRYGQAYLALGFGRGSAFSLLTRSRTDAIPLTFAGQALGMRYTALHAMGSEQDHAFILEDAEIDLLIVDEGAFLDRAKALRARLPGLRILTLGPSREFDDFFTAAAKHDVGPLPTGALPGDIASVSYTGGTTGRPKGVILPHRSVVTATLMELAVWEWPTEIRFLSATPLSHATALMLPPTLIRGGTFFVADRFDPESFLETVQNERITATFLVPTMIYRLLDHPARDRFDLSSLKMIIYGAAPMSPQRLAEALEVFGPVFCQLYGQTEAPQVVSYLSKGDHDPMCPELLGSCGTSTPGIDVRILDDDGVEVAPGEVGEICVRGPLVMGGYWKRPQETEHVFRGGWLHTSDMARMDPRGYITIVDRAKDMIISGGFNVYPREVEDAIQTHESVSGVAVIGVPDSDWGEAVAAFVKLVPGSVADEEGLRVHVRALKGPLHTPKFFVFVDDLPETAVGKIDKKELRKSYWKDEVRNV